MRVISQSFAAVAMQHIRAFRALERGEECAELAEIRRTFRLSETESVDGGFPLPVRTVAERKSGRREPEEEEEEVEVELEASASRPGSTARALAADVLAADDSSGAKDEGTRQLGALAPPTWTTWPPPLGPAPPCRRGMWARQRGARPRGAARPGASPPARLQRPCLADALLPLRRLTAANALLLLKVQELQEELRATQEGLEDGGEAAEPEEEVAPTVAQSDASAAVPSDDEGVANDVMVRGRKQLRTQSRQDPGSTRRSSKREKRTTRR